MSNYFEDFLVCANPCIFEQNKLSHTKFYLDFFLLLKITNMSPSASAFTCR